MLALRCVCGHEMEVSDAVAAVTCPRCGQSVNARSSNIDLAEKRAGTGNTDAPRTSPTVDIPLKPKTDVPPRPRSAPAEFAFLAPPDEAGELGRMSHYRVKKLLGQGGMGMVFQALDVHLNRSVALKVMRPEMGQNLEYKQRFLREARATAAIKSDYIVTIYRVDQENEVPFLAMEFLEGMPLDRWLEVKGKPSIPEMVRVSIEMARGLDAAHQRGLIHRDIKPANVWIEEPNGRVKILDFGLARMDAEGARLTQTGLIMGTPEYMAPEQAEGAVVDARGDLYSLGCVMYEMLTGNPPFIGPNVMSILKAVATEKPVAVAKLNSDVPGDLADIVMLLLEKKPEDRYQSAAEVVADLEELGLAACPNQSMEAKRPSQARRLAQRRWATSRRMLLAGIGLGVLGMLAALYVIDPHLFTGGGSETTKPEAGATFRGVTGNQVLLGMTGPFSGPDQNLGRNMQVGIDTYLRHINSAGGVAGRQIRLIPLDDKHDPEMALANVRDLYKNHKVFAMVGLIGSEGLNQIVPYALDQDLMLFGSQSGSNILRKANPPEAEIFNFRASYEEETATLVKYLTGTRGIKPGTIAVFCQDDGAGTAGYQGTIKALRKLGVQPDDVLKRTYERGTIDVSKAVATILKRPDIKAVVMAGTYIPSARFISMVRDARPDLVFASISCVGAYPLAEMLQTADRTGKYTDGILITSVVPLPESHSSTVRKFQEHLKKYYPSEHPNFSSLEGYLVAMLFCEGLRRAGDNLTFDSLVQALEGIQDLDIGIGAKVSFGPSDHQASHKVWLTMLDAKGQFKLVDVDD